LPPSDNCRCSVNFTAIVSIEAAQTITTKGCEKNWTSGSLLNSIYKVVDTRVS
jgi:hypothetical protein